MSKRAFAPTSVFTWCCKMGKIFSGSIEPLGQNSASEVEGTGGFAKQKLVRGFTLVELLVVISVIVLLSSIIFAVTSTAQVQARDMSRISQVTEVKKALQQYQLDQGHMPASDILNVKLIEGTLAYNNAMQELVTKKYLPSIPTSPDGQSYSYTNFGDDSSVGAIFEATLENPQNASKTSECGGNVDIAYVGSSDVYIHWLTQTGAASDSITYYDSTTKAWLNYVKYTFDGNGSPLMNITYNSGFATTKPVLCHKTTSDYVNNTVSQEDNVQCPDAEPVIQFVRDITTANVCLGGDTYCACIE